MPVKNMEVIPQEKETVENLLAKAGLGRGKTLREKLSKAGLETDDILDIVAGIAKYGDSDAMKLRAAELALKLNGDLAETDKPIPVVNIIINDPNSNFTVNPILLPR